MNDKLISRKFILSLLVMVCGTALIGFGKIDGEQWTELSMMTLGGFTLGNVCEHFLTNRSS